MILKLKIEMNSVPFDNTFHYKIDEDY